MTRRTPEDWARIWNELKKAVSAGDCPPNLKDGAAYFGIRYSTFRTQLSAHVPGYSLAALVALSPEPEETPAAELAEDYEISEEGNEATVIYSGGVIKTEEELIEACDVDLDTWEKERLTVNSWTTSIKVNQGKGRPPAVVQVPNFQVKLFLKRRQLIEINPAIYPVDFTVKTAPRKPGRRLGGWKMALVIFDPHFGFKRNMETGDLTPFHDYRVLDIAEQIIEKYGADRVIGGGDWLDLPDTSTRFPSPPDIRFNTQAALIMARYWLAALGVEVMVEGNHDDRPGRAILEYNKAEAFGLRAADDLEGWPIFTVPNLLGLDSLGIDYLGPYPGGEVWLNHAVRIIHGKKVVGKPGRTATAVVENSNHSTLFGHIHRSESATKKVRGDFGSWKWIEAVCPGCACHVDGRVPGSENSHNWGQGLGRVYYHEDGRHFADGIRIENGVAVFNGDVIEARDRAGEMESVIAEGMDRIDQARRERVG